MDCPNCHQPVEAGAAFCGNCGQALAPAPVQAAVAASPMAAVPAAPAPGTVPAAPAPLPSAPTPAAAPFAGPSPIAQVYANQPLPGAPAPPYPASFGAPVAAPGGFVPGAAIPTYAVPVAGHQNGETKALLSLIFGLAGIGGALFIPLIGIGLGVAGIVLGTLSRRSVKRGLSTAGLILSILAVLAGLASWAYVIAHDPRFDHKITAKNDPALDGTAQTAASVATPCYSINFSDTLHVNNTSGSCDLSIYDGPTIDQSDDAYKIYGSTVHTITTDNFATVAKQAIENDVQQTLPSFNVTQETSGSFAGSPAYFVTASNGAGVSVMEAAALHTVSNGDNFFVFVHAVNGDTVDLNTLQAGWQWQ